MSLKENLDIACNEKDVENSYRKAIQDKIKGLIFTSPFGCDGYGEFKKIKILCEFKNDVDLTSKQSQCKILAQSIYYLKRFELSGKKLPTTIFVGDKNECFVIHTNDVFKYLSYEYDWDVAPSNAHSNIDLMMELLDDPNINPFIFHPNEIDQCIEKINNLTDGIKRLVPITKHNITEVFKYFDEKVLGKNVKLNTNERANLFVQLLINPEENYLHPVKLRKTLITKGFGEIPIKNRDIFLGFFEHFSQEYTPRQKEVLTAIVDRLVEDTTRRKQGEFFTPAIWVDKAHEYISNTFGDDWKEKYVVWDPAWGTGNLTRDYKFKELYSSTLNQSDIDTANQMGYNNEGVKFQFDFLNDDDEKLPKGLRDAIESGREIIVLMNPPYGKPTPINSLLLDNKTKSSGMTTTKTQEQMKNDKMGLSSSNLYTQFLYKISKYQENNKNIRIGCFTPPGFLTSVSNSNFRKNFLTKFGFENGFMMDSINFSDTKSWGLTFSVFSNDIKDNKFEFSFNVLNISVGNFEITLLRDKILYNTDSIKTLTEWFNETPTKNNIQYPVFESSLGVVDYNKNGCSDAIIYLNNDSNNVQQQNVIHLLSGVCKANGNKPITPANFERGVVVFSSRKMILRNWVIDKDEYLVPNENHEQYEQFSYDSIIISLFHIHSFQSSLRQVEYKNQLWDIKNEFFWLSKNDMLDLADQNHYTELYNDARTSDNRFVYKKLFEEGIYDRLSDDAKQVLDFATELLKKSIKARRIMADNHNHLNSWDCGYAQLKLVWQEYFKDEFKEFRKKYKELEDRMRPLVYELGFLKK
jgi:hypothetical protein